MYAQAFDIAKYMPSSSALTPVMPKSSSASPGPGARTNPKPIGTLPASSCSLRPFRASESDSAERHADDTEGDDDDNDKKAKKKHTRDGDKNAKKKKRDDKSPEPAPRKKHHDDDNDDDSDKDGVPAKKRPSAKSNSKPSRKDEKRKKSSKKPSKKEKKSGKKHVFGLDEVPVSSNSWDGSSCSDGNSDPDTEDCQQPQ